ncbi:MAG TPA: site-2 protease family protein, partial [Pirellulaceae bacterium]|nr:site-2 protease family protein [Pirellulaceae bacterium]
MDLCLIAQSFSWFSLSSWWAIAQVVIGLGFVIFVNELGHFLVAKACGVKCEKFYVGFDAFEITIAGRVIVPRALWKKQWGETEYGIGIVPLGGYIKMLGQDDNPANFEAENERAMGDHATAALPEGVAGTVNPLDRSQYDPRSYLAKSVPQRMAIISAGVIFNLIFAVVFAAIAFQIGVNYNPAMVGVTFPGGPAWEADLDGATILRMGDKRFDEGYKTFIDMAQEAALHGAQSPIEIEYRLNGDPGDAPSRVAVVTPKIGLVPKAPFAMIGAERMQTNRLDKITPARPWSSASRAQPALHGNDRIVEIAGQPVHNISDIMRELAARADETVTLVIERTHREASERMEVVVPPNPMRDVGFYCEWGCIHAVQKNSPAEQAGFQVGDQLTHLDGEPVGDLLTLDLRLIRRMRAGQAEVSITVQRESADGDLLTPVVLKVQPRQPRVNPQWADRLLPIVTLGIAVESTLKVAHVEPGSTVAQQGLRPGDMLTRLAALHTPEQKKNSDYKFRKNSWDLVAEDLYYTTFSEMMNSAAPDLLFALTVQDTSGQERTVEFRPIESNTYFIPQRGLILVLLENEYKSAGWSESISLGFRQTIQETTRIVRILRQVVTGQLSLTNFGGPGTIAVVATGEASAGTSRLLLFLTLFSANLAVINFLPIPVLDGGHMMFLAY